jgi:hypothetical protein
VSEVRWNKPAVRGNVVTSRRDGHIVIEPEVAVAYEVDSREIRESRVVPEETQLAEQLREIHRRQEPDSPQQ